MGFKKIKYGEDIIVETLIKDEREAIVGRWKFAIGDIFKWANMTAHKYGIKKKVDKDLDWLK